MMLTRPQRTATSTKWGAAEAASLEKGLATLGLFASSLQLSSLHSYAALLLKWNRTYNLLGADDAQTLLDEHLLDSLATLPALQRWLPAAMPEARLRLLDIGAGAGLPGIVLAMMLPQLPVTLVEPIGKKAAFMRQAIAHCRLENADVFEGRIEDLQLERPIESTGRAVMVPFFICRAFTSLARFSALCRPHTRQGSLLFAMKASRVLEEIAALASAEILAVEPLNVGERDVQRNLVVMRLIESDAP